MQKMEAKEKILSFWHSHRSFFMGPLTTPQSLVPSWGLPQTA